VAEALPAREDGFSNRKYPFDWPMHLHIPVVGSQSPATWHWSSGSQMTLPPAVQVPD